MKERLVNVGVKMTPASKTRVEAEAAERGISPSSLIRIIVENFFNPEVYKKENEKFRQDNADLLRIILVMQGRGPQSTEMADSVVDNYYLAKESLSVTQQ